MPELPAEGSPDKRNMYAWDPESPRENYSSLFLLPCLVESFQFGYLIWKFCPESYLPRPRVTVSSFLIQACVLTLVPQGGP